MKMWNSRGIAPGIFQMNWTESNRKETRNE